VSNHTGDDGRVPQDDLKKSSAEIWEDRDLYFSFRTSSEKECIIMSLCPGLLHAALSIECPQKNLMPVLTIPSPSAKLEKVTALSLGSGSDFSAYLRTLFFRNYKTSSSARLRKLAPQIV